MPDFVEDDLALPGPKVDFDGSSTVDDEPDMFCSSGDYNALRDAANSLRTWVKPGLAPGVHTNATVTVNADGKITGVVTGSGGGLADGDYGDVTVSGGGTAMTVDELAAIKVQIVASAAVLAGDGHDGNISLTGTINLTRNMYWNIGTVAVGGCTVNTNGYVPFFKVLDAALGTVTFQMDGAAAVGNAAGTGYVNVGILKVNSGDGAAGNFNNGGTGSASAAGNWPTSFPAGLGGAGGNGSTAGGKVGGAGGAAPTTVPDANGSVNDLQHWLVNQLDFASSTRVAGGSGGGAGGGSGAAAAGGSGAGGGVCKLVCGQVITPTNVTVSADGGAGGAGQAIGCGGGGGGGGGYAGVAVMQGGAASINVHANGGVGGAMGAGVALGTQNGANGPAGKVQRFG